MEENSSELENLYAKAAKHFPLKTDSANWQVVLEQLEKEDTKIPFWWNIRKAALALMLMGFIGGSILIVTKFIDSKTAFNKVFEKKQATEKQLLEIKTQNKNLEQIIADRVYKKVIDSLNKQNGVVNDNINIAQIKSSFKSKKSDKIQDIKSSNVVLDSKKFVTNKVTVYDANTEIKISESIAVVDSNELIKKTNVANSEFSISNNEDSIYDKKNFKNNNISKVDSLKKDVATVANNKNTFHKYFYIGSMYALQKCSVQNEGFKGDGDDVGYNVSFLLGYRFSKIFSVETGFSFQSKEYYTTSKGFNKNVLQATGNVLGVEADNKLIEIPISLKIDLFNKNKNNFFANIGVCSYIVNKEVYEFEQELNGVHTDESVQYKNTTSNFLGAYNFSLGYEYQFKRIGSLRIQPYLSVPLNGVGKGNQPIVSKGIYFGWIYNFKN